MLKELFDRILDVADERADAIHIDDRTFSRAKLYELPNHPLASALKVSTIGAIAEYLEANRDELDLKTIILHVESSRSIRLFGPLNNDRRRETLLVAEALRDVFPVDRFMSLEAMNIELRTSFRNDGDRQALMDALGSVVGESIRTTSDDGFSQQVEAKRGVATRDWSEIPNPVTLYPLETFDDLPDDDIPAHVYLVRLKEIGEQIQAGLFPVRGPWEAEARAAVASHLEGVLEVSGLAVPILV